MVAGDVAVQAKEEGGGEGAEGAEELLARTVPLPRDKVFQHVDVRLPQVHLTVGVGGEAGRAQPALELLQAQEGLIRGSRSALPETLALVAAAAAARHDAVDGLLVRLQLAQPVGLVVAARAHVHLLLPHRRQPLLPGREPPGLHRLQAYSSGGAR